MKVVRKLKTTNALGCRQVRYKCDINQPGSSSRQSTGCPIDIETTNNDKTLYGKSCVSKAFPSELSNSLEEDVATHEIRDARDKTMVFRKQISPRRKRRKQFFVEELILTDFNTEPSSTFTYGFSFYQE